jgi:hypothetical protein
MTSEERVKAVARVLIRHLPVECRNGRCVCGQEWSPLHQAKALDHAGLLCALHEATS